MNKFQEIIKENFHRGDEERVVLNEVKLSRILKYHLNNGFILISSDRSERTPEQNKAKFERLKKDVREAGYSYIPVYGGYIENKGEPTQKEVEEKTLLVPNKKGHVGFNNEIYKLGIRLAKKYNQESFFYKPGGKSYYIKPSGEVDVEFDDYSLNDATREYFTKFHNSKSKVDRRITFESLSINNSPKCVSEATTRYGEVFLNFEGKSNGGILD